MATGPTTTTRRRSPDGRTAVATALVVSLTLGLGACGGGGGGAGTTTIIPTTIIPTTLAPTTLAPTTAVAATTASTAGATTTIAVATTVAAPTTVAPATSAPSATTRIVVTAPAPRALLSTPFRVAGRSSTFENTVQIALIDSTGRHLVDTFTTGHGPIMDDQGRPVLGPFEASIAFDPGAAVTGTLLVFESSPADGTMQQLVSVPVRFVPGGGSSAVPGASLAPKATPDTPGGPGDTAQLVDVRVGRHVGFERVVFEFSNTMPGYRVGYVDRPITADPSDLPLSVGGEGLLLVRLSSASGVDLTSSDAHRTYTGPDRIGVGWPAVDELVQVGDYEAVLSWAVGVWTRPPFAVTTLSNPPRLVVDITSAAHVPGT